MCQPSQLCWNFLSARRTKVLLKVPFYFISAGGGWRSHWEHLSLYWLYTKILYLMQYCTHSVLNIEKKALLLLLKLISRKISWNWFHGKSALLWNQTSLLCSVQRLTQPQAQHHISRLENPHNFLQNPTFTSSAQISSLSSHWGEVIATCCKCDGKIMSCFCI